jgi:hypothetical protein
MTEDKNANGIFTGIFRVKGKWVKRPKMGENQV